LAKANLDGRLMLQFCLYTENINNLSLAFRHKDHLLEKEFQQQQNTTKGSCSVNRI